MNTFHGQPRHFWFWKDVVKDLPSTPGVYCITCGPTGEQYVGKAKNLRRRAIYHIHLMMDGRHHVKAMNEAAATHGIKAFRFEVLEHGKRDGETEAMWIAKLNPTFNRYRTGFTVDGCLRKPPGPKRQKPLVAAKATKLHRRRKPKPFRLTRSIRFRRRAFGMPLADEIVPRF